MKLVSNWGRVLRHAWSVRLTLLAALLLVAQVAQPMLPYFEDAMPRIPFLILTLVTNLAALGARLVKQRTVSDGNDQD